MTLLMLAEAAQRRCHFSYSSIFSAAFLRFRAASLPDTFSARASRLWLRTLSLICSRSKTPEAVMPEHQRLSAEKAGSGDCQTAVRGLPAQPAWVLHRWWFSQSTGPSQSKHPTPAPVETPGPASAGYLHSLALPLVAHPVEGHLGRRLQES